jgi:gamma-glutamylputrescine oxidase
MSVIVRRPPTAGAATHRRTSTVPPSHWFAGDGGEDPPSPATLPPEAEVVVVGGGVMGIATTYWLARRGVDVLLLEARRLGWGATGRNAGLLLASSQALERMALIREVVTEEAIDAEFEEQGHLALASSEVIWERMRDEVARRPATAPPLHALSRPDCEQLLGMRISPAFLGGRWLPRAAAVHPVRLVRELAERARRRGATIACGVRVRRVVPAVAGGPVTVATSRGPVRGRAVVLACGARTGMLLPALRAVLRPSRAQMCSTQPLPHLFDLGLAVDWGSYYWRQARDGAVILGGGDTREDEPAGMSETVDDAVQRDLAALLPTLFPDLPPIRIERRWTGVMDHTPDGQPVVGPWPGSEGIWTVAGFGGHGLPPALGVGAAVAESLVGAPSPLLSRLDPARFQRSLSC